MGYSSSFKINYNNTEKYCIIKPCFNQAMVEYDMIVSIDVFLLKDGYGEISPPPLKYDEYDIISYLDLLKNMGLKAEYMGYTENSALFPQFDKWYTIRVKKEDFKNKVHFLMCLKAIRYLYENEKNDIPREAMKLRRRYTLLDPMECFILAHYCSSNSYMRHDHYILNGTPKLSNVWTIKDKLDGKFLDSTHSLFDLKSDLGAVQRIDYTNLYNAGKIENLIKALK